MKYTTQDVLDYLDRSFAVPDSGFESDVTWSDLRESATSFSDNDSKLNIILPRDLLEPDHDVNDVRNVTLEDEEGDDEDNDRCAVGRPSNYKFDDIYYFYVMF